MAKKTTKKPTNDAPTNNRLTEEIERLADERELIVNALLGRSNFLQRLTGQSNQSTRDIDKSCGYPETNCLEEYYATFYERHPIAARVVEVEPEESWKGVPTIFENEEDSDTQFEKDWKELSLTLDNKSKFKSKAGSPIWEYLKRVDILSGVGHFGVLFLGLNDGEDFNKEVKPTKNMKLLYLRAFSEKDVDISRYESDKNNPRYGLPVTYSITFSNAEDSKGGIGVQEVVHEVHYSRVIHIADNMKSNEVFGVPRMRPVFNRLWDLRKLYGGSGEMYWKGAFPGLSIETHPHLGGAVTVDTSSLKDNLSNYMEGLQRYLTLKGMQAKSLSPQVVDPTPQIMTQIEAICIQKGIPKRIFIGSERGELASSQDQDAWNGRMKKRQEEYITPRIIVPFIDRLIELGVLTEPVEFCCTWPDLDTQTEDEKSSVAIKKVHALTKYVAGDVEHIMSPEDFFVSIMGLDEEEANAILERAVEAFEEGEMRDLNREIIEMKALKKHRSPLAGDDVKQQLLEMDEAESVELDALSDKFTSGAEEKKKVNSLTSSRVSDADDLEDGTEDEELI